MSRHAQHPVRSVDEHVPRGVTVHLSYGDELAEEYVRQLAADALHAVLHLFQPGGDLLQLPGFLYEGVGARC